MPERSVITWTAIVSVYAQKGYMDEARSLFEEMPERNAVSWNAMIKAYDSNGFHTEALDAFQTMILEGAPPDEITLMTVLSACSHVGSMSRARQVFVTFLLMPWRTVISWTGMVSAYAHHGILSEARQAFEAMPWKNLVSWNVVLEAYARNVWGCREALALFHVMNLEGMVPDEASFTSILAACAHIGVVSEACGYLRLMNEYSDLRPARGHYNCIVDLLGRTGELAAAEGVIAAMPVPPDAVSWRSLLGACRNHGDSDRGGRAAARVVELDDEDTAVYSLLSELIWQGDREGVAMDWITFSL
ncbi:hypothetical protein SELMODRAFT_121537 [Selaginella moellendorffii]|uniref:Pentacotripeptide-repeat region of PRORP domain-containing protein n=1 Tax=Selaginella moellendorffii TaxID=88036 RepID=D8SNR0_SELML|nr:hypothetical protein SELMODRAFT_121537 [Selaginella moellendorffii]